MTPDLSDDAVRQLLARERSLLHERALEIEREHADEVPIEVVRRSLGEVESALARIALGTWGVCECGAEIETYRLRKHPATLLCARCAG